MWTRWSSACGSISTAEGAAGAKSVAKVRSLEIAVEKLRRVLQGVDAGQHVDSEGTT